MANFSATVAIATQITTGHFEADCVHTALSQANIKALKALNDNGFLPDTSVPVRMTLEALTNEEGLDGTSPSVAHSALVTLQGQVLSDRRWSHEDGIFKVNQTNGSGPWITIGKIPSKQIAETLGNAFLSGLISFD